MFNKSSLRLLTRSQYYLARDCFDTPGTFDAIQTESFIIIIIVLTKLPQPAFSVNSDCNWIVDRVVLI